MRILWAISGIGRGHVARCRPLLAELGARGHTSVAAVPGARAAAALDGACEVRTPPPGYRERVAPPPAQRPPYVDVHDTEATLSAYQRDPADGLAATIAFLDDALEDVAPDLVVVDQIMGAGPLARARGLPVVQVSHPPMLPGHGPWARWARGRDPRTRVPPAAPVLAAAFAAVGAEPAPRDAEELLAGDLIVVPSAPVFGTCAGALHVAPADELGDLPAPPPARPGGAPRVAVYLGGGAEPLAADVVAGVLAAGADALVLAGDRLGLPAALLGDPRVTVTGPARMDAALAGSRAIVHHGGSGTAHAALLAGVPAVAVPTNTEQELNARTVEALGAGRHVPVSPHPLEPFVVTPRYTTLAHREVVTLDARVGVAVRDLLQDPAAPLAARRAGDEIAALPPISRAADAVEALVGVPPVTWTQPAPASLDGRLAELDVPQAHRLVVTGEGLGGRIHAVPALHRAVPLPVAVALAGARGRAEWRLLPGRRADAVERARVLAPPGTPEAVIAALARAHLRERCVQTELSWRPWDARRMPVEGLDRLRDALAGGRGAILATLHAGPWLNLVHALQARGLRLNLSGGRRLWEPPLEGHEGRWIKTQNVWAEEAGARWVRKPGSFEVVRALLGRGELCWMNWDVPGNTPAVFLGRPVTAASGIARLALELGTPVLPALVLRRGLGQVAVLGAPLAPEPGDDAARLTARIGAALSAELGPHRAQAHVALVRWMMGDL